MPIALSWSRLSDFLQCPLKFNLKYILKAFPPEDQKSIHLIKGEQLHLQMEQYVLAKNRHIPMPSSFSPEVEQTIPLVDKFYEVFPTILPEAQVACKLDWTPDEWFGKQVAWRAIWDLICISDTQVFVGDYKTGKIYPYANTYGQLHLSAVIALNRFPNVQKVDVSYLYMEHKKTQNFSVTREELPKIQEYFDIKWQAVNSETKWEPKVNEYCKYCPANRSQCPKSRKM